MDRLRSAYLLLLVKMICLPRLTLREKQSLFLACGMYGTVCQSTSSYYFARQMCPIWSCPQGTSKDSWLQIKEIASCSLNPCSFPRQTNKKIPKKKKKKGHPLHTRLSEWTVGWRALQREDISRHVQTILWRSESEPPVLDTTLTQMSGHHPVSSSPVFMVQISAGRRCPRTELRGLFML